MDVEWVAILVPIGFFAAVAFITYAVLQARVRRETQQIALHGQILDRVGSAREFGEFLSTDAGARFMAALSSRTTASSARMRVFGSVRTGTMLLTIGLALFIGIFFRAFGSDGEDFAIVATLLAATGLGMLLAAAASYVVGRRLGMFDPEGPGGGTAGVTSAL